MDGNTRFGPENPPNDPNMIEVAQAPSTEPIGQVDSVKGDAYIIRVDGSTVPAETGQQIFLGDVVETGPKGAIGLVFVDDSTFSLADSGKMTIDELVYDPATNQGKSLFNVAQGVFTFVSGEIAKTSVDAMQIETPVATIGIRGTAGGGRIVRPIDPNLPPSGSFSNFRDPITGQAGEINVSTPTGSRTLNTVNAMTNVPNPFVPPSPPVKIPLNALRAVFGAAVAALPKPPARAQQQNQGNDEGPGAQQGGGQQGQQGQQGGDDILTEGDPAQSGEADAQAAADAAAAAAFNEALAQGLDPGDALALAGAVAEQTTARFGVDTTLMDTFSTQNAIDDVLTTITQTTVGQPTTSQLGNSVIGGGQGDTGLIGGTGNDNALGPGIGEPEGPILDEQLIDDLFQEFLNSFLPQETFLVTDQQQTDDGDTVDVIIVDTESGETTNLSATDDNDVLFGGSGGDEFLMYDGISLGGDDIVDGGGGTDYLTLLDIQDGWLRYDPSASTTQIEYGFNYYESYGTITLNSVEQIYVAPFGVDYSSIASVPGITLNTAGDGLLLPVSGSLVSFVGIGYSGIDYLSVGDYSDPLKETSILPSEVGGSILFGLEGNDTLTGADGVDILFGGADSDALTGGAGNDIIFGGSDVDAIYVGAGDDYADGGADDDIFFVGAGEQTGGTLIGGTGTDVIRLEGLNDFTGVAISGIESLYFESGGGSATFHSSQIGAGAIDTINFNSSGALSVYMDTTNVDLSSLTLSNQTNGAIVVNGSSGSDNITAAAGLAQETLFGGAGDDYITAATGNVYMDGGADDDTYYFEAGTAGSGTVVHDTGTGDNDTIQLGGDNDFTSSSIGGVSTLSLNTFNATVAADQFQDIQTVLFDNAGAESLTINMATSGTVDLSAKTLTNLSAADSITITGSSGADIIVGSAEADTIADGSGSDTITGGGGTDAISLSTDGTSDTLVFDTVGDFGDTVTGFIAGAGGDILDLNAATSRGNMVEYQSGDGSLGANTGILAYSGPLNGISAADIEINIDVDGLAADDSLYLIVSDGTDTKIYYWQDASSAGGNSDGLIDAAELTEVVLLDGITDVTSLLVENFEGFEEFSISVSGTQTVTMNSGINDPILGSAGADQITLSGAAEFGDTIDLAGGTDSLTLDATANTLTIYNTETVLIQSGGTQSLTFEDATTVTFDNYSGSVSDADAQLILDSKSGALDQTWTFNFLAGSAGNFAASTIDMGDGTDVLRFTGSGDITIGATQLTGVETLQHNAAGNITLTSALASLTSLSSITSNTIKSITALDVSNAVSMNFTANDTATYTLKANSTSSFNDISWSSISTRAFGGGLNLATDQSYNLNIGSNFRNAFQSQFGKAAITLTTAISSSVIVNADSSFDAVRGITFDGALGTGMQTINATGQSDNVIVGTGAITAGLEGGDDTIHFVASSFDNGDSVDGGAGTDLFKFSGGGVIADTAFQSTLAMEEIDLDGNHYDLTLGTAANTAFSTGVAITSSQVSQTLTLDASGYTAGAVSVDLSSSTAADSIVTGSTDDMIVTGGGDDIIYSGDGNDTLTGGAGRDTFILNDSGSGLDTITDFTPTDDLIGVQSTLLSTLSGYAFTQTTSSGGFDMSGIAVVTDSIDTTSTTSIATALTAAGFTGAVSSQSLLIVGNASDSQIYLLSNDSTDFVADAELTLIADLQGVDETARTSLSAENFAFGTAFIGTAGNDTLTGTAAMDTIFGLGGDDTISDGAGADLIFGGQGADTIQLTDDVSDADVLRYVSSDFQWTDAVTGFRRGSGGDIFDLDVAGTVSHGLGDKFENLSGTTAMNADTAIVNYTDTIAQDATTVASTLSGLGSFAADTKLFMITTDGTDSVLWYWDDSSGVSNGAVDSSEMHQIATITGEYSQNPTSFTADNFEGVTPTLA